MKQHYTVPKSISIEDKDLIEELFSRISYKDFEIHITDIAELNVGWENEKTKFVIFCISTHVRCIHTNKPINLFSQPEMVQLTKGDNFVYRVFDLIQKFENHEMREQFKYRNQAVFTEHAGLSELFKIADTIDGDIVMAQKLEPATIVPKTVVASKRWLCKYVVDPAKGFFELCVSRSA